MTDFIFVYGTLLKTATNMHNVLARHCEYFSDGYMQGILYDVDGYPGAVESEKQNEKIYGELYTLGNSELVLAILDEYEECTAKHPAPHEYIRKKITVSRDGEDTVSAWVYVFNRDVSNLRQIESGDYLNYLNETE